MHKAIQYRAYAAAAMKLAASARDEQDRSLMLEIAQGWLDLAERQARDRWDRREAWMKPHGKDAGPRRLN
jgi:hypothetical protein